MSDLRPTVQKAIIVDDDPLTGYIFEKVNAIVHFAHSIQNFYSAVDGLDYLLSLSPSSSDMPDAIFLDIGMPIVNGWQFLERITAYDDVNMQNSSIYMLTASADQSDINRAKKFANVEDYLVKPLTVDRLRALQAKTRHSSMSTSTM